MMVVRGRGIALILIVAGLAISGAVLVVVPRAGARSPAGISGSPGTPSPNGRIAFSSGRNGRGEIYTVNPDGSDLRQLTSGAVEHFGPTWSPDGTKIAFYQTIFFPSADSPIPPGAQPPVSIHVMNADGSDQRNLTPDDSHDFGGFVWSPDGTRLALECSPTAGGGGNGQICVLNVDGTGLQRIVPPDLRGFTPVWSPDGHWIAFRAEPAPGVMPMGIYLVSPDGKQRQTVQRDADFPGALAWSPDGSQLAYAHGMGSRTLAVVNIDGSDVQHLDTGDRVPSAPSWSPDGRQLLFSWESPDHSPSGLAVITSDGVGLRDIAPTTDDIVSAVWSPDGNAIAVTRGFLNHSLATPGVATLRTELDVVPLDGSPVRTVAEEIVATAGEELLDSRPSWQPVAASSGT